jgi:hypothetical protein
MIQESRSNRAWKMAPPTSGLKNVNQILVLAFCIKYPLFTRDLFFNAKKSIIDCSLNIKGTPCKNIYCEPHTFPTELYKKLFTELEVKIVSELSPTPLMHVLIVSPSANPVGKYWFRIALLCL